MRTLDAAVQVCPSSSTWSTLLNSVTASFAKASTDAENAGNNVQKAPLSISLVSVHHCEISEDGNNRRPVIVLGYTQRIEVWDWESPSKMREIWSYSSTSVGTISYSQIVHAKATGVKDPYTSSRPHIAFMSETNDKCFLRIRSLRDTRVLLDIDTGSVPAIGLSCCSDYVCVLFPSQVLVYDAVSYTPQHVLTDVKYALQQPWSLWTAEGKWVAYAVDIPPERANPSLLEEASKLAGKVIDKMKDYGQEKYENYFNSGKEGPKEAERKFIKGMEDGWVLVRNLDKKGEYVAYWRPHTQPLNHIKFSNSGTKTITTPIGASAFHIWDLAGASQPICTHVLQRGYTFALVLDMSFSPDDTWLSVTTNHGTTHLFSCQASDKHSAQLRIRRQEKEGAKKDHVSILSAKLLKMKDAASSQVSAIDSQGKLVLHSLDLNQSAGPTIQSLSCWDFGKSNFSESSSGYKWDVSVIPLLKNSGNVVASNTNEWHAYLDAVSYPDTSRPIWSNPNVTFDTFGPQSKQQEFKEGHPDLTDLPATNRVNLYTSVALPNGYSSTSSKFPTLNSAHKQVEEALSGALQSDMDTDSKEVIAPRMDKRRDDLPFDDEWTVQLQMQDVEGHEASTSN